MSDDVTIHIKRDTWKELNRRKEPGDSFDTVIWRILDTPRERDEHVATVRAHLVDAELNSAEIDAVVAMHDVVAKNDGVPPRELQKVHDEYPAGKDQEWWWKKLSTPLESLECISRPSQRRFKHEAE